MRCSVRVPIAVLELDGDEAKTEIVMSDRFSTCSANRLHLVAQDRRGSSTRPTSTSPAPEMPRNRHARCSRTVCSTVGTMT